MITLLMCIYLLDMSEHTYKWYHQVKRFCVPKIPDWFTNQYISLSKLVSGSTVRKLSSITQPVYKSRGLAR